MAGEVTRFNMISVFRKRLLLHDTMWEFSVFNGIDHDYALGGKSVVVGKIKSIAWRRRSFNNKCTLFFFWIRRVNERKIGFCV